MHKNTIKIGEIEGWRCWKALSYGKDVLFRESINFQKIDLLKHTEIRLGSIYMDDVWNPGVNTCVMPPDKKLQNLRKEYLNKTCPDTNSPSATLFKKFPLGDEWWGAGYHAFEELECLEKYVLTSTFSFVIVGKVYLWGDVIECAKGWRASHASVKSIDHIQRWHTVDTWTKTKEITDPFSVKYRYQKTEIHNHRVLDLLREQYDV